MPEIQPTSQHAVGIQPLSQADATRLDSRIRLMVSTIQSNLDTLMQRVAEAKAGQIHVALGFPSWTAYAADALKVTSRLDREQRRELVGMLSDEGMSTRAIAETVGISKNTVTADLSQIGTPDGDDEGEVDHGDIATGLRLLVEDGLLHHDDADWVADEIHREGKPFAGDVIALDLDRRPTPKPTTGLDGKTYPKPVPQAKPKPRRPITDAADDVARDMRKLYARINSLIADDRFSANAENIADRIRPYNVLLPEAVARLTAGFGRQVTGQ